jgi:uncharacterized protein (DUF302 family)
VARVREELGREGFGVLCEIDVQTTLKQKLAVDRDPCLILGACNPALAHRALEAERELGVLSPCNVIVYEHQRHAYIATIDAERTLSIVDSEQLTPIAAEVRQQLSAVVERSTER